MWHAISGGLGGGGYDSDTISLRFLAPGPGGNNLNIVQTSENLYNNMQNTTKVNIYEPKHIYSARYVLIWELKDIRKYHNRRHAKLK